MDTDPKVVSPCGREKQKFAMDLMMQLSSTSMGLLKEAFEAKEIHVEDVWL